MPTEVLYKQWYRELLRHRLLANSEILIINTAIKEVRECDLLIIDEAHRCGAETFSKIFKVVKYKIILCLTGTLERLDGKHEIIEKHCPVVDVVGIEECIKNNWLSPYREYKILIEAPDIHIYQEYDRKFKEAFAFFGNDFALAMSCIGKNGWKAREKLLKDNFPGATKEELKKYRAMITAATFSFINNLMKRKEFINNHPKKVDIANLILDYRTDKKAITFSPTIAIANKIKGAYVLHSKRSAKSNEEALQLFSQSMFGVLSSSKAVNEGLDIPGINLAIILGNTSSKTEKRQRIGRVIRYQPDKEAEVFTLVLKDTVEERWHENSSSGISYITLDEDNLLNLLKNEPFTTKKNIKSKFIFRF